MNHSNAELHLSRFRRFFEKGTLILGWSPVLWLLALLSFVGRARVHLGYWPRPSAPDPKLLPFAIHYLFLENSMFIMMATSVLLILGTFLWTRQVSLKVWKKSLLTLVVGWVLIILMFEVPPIDFVN